MMEHVYNCMGHELKIPRIVDSKGIYVFDDKGKRYMDLESGVWCISVGHKNDRITKAITRQMDSLMHAGYCYSATILSRFESLADEFIVTAVRGRGLMFAVDLANSGITNQIHSELIERGYIVGNRGTAFRIDPPLITTEDKFDEFINAFRAVLTSKKGITPS
jgi:4-aminobutyrate aminotransferase-like enzyme